jgi:hypothetical protein
MMNPPGLVKYTLALVAIVICSGCAPLRQAQDDMAVAPSAATPNATYAGRTLFLNGRPVTAARPPGAILPGALPRFATILPDRRGGHKKYEYIFGFYGSYAGIFHYPKSTAMVGELNGAGGQGCTNALYGYGKKIVWNAGRTSDLITEYEVPSNKVLKTLSLDYTYTSSCAMNTSGNLAVGILLGNSSDDCGGQVVIFKHARGSGTVYKTPLCKEYFDGYDPSGNLFADGLDSNYNFALVELPKGSSTFQTIATSNTVDFPGSVQWDGTYLAVTDQSTSQIYQYTVSGTTATLKGTVSFSGVGDCAQTWITKNVVYCADADNEDGEVFQYPAGGSAIAVLGSGIPTPLGVTAAKE